MFVPLVTPKMRADRAFPEGLLIELDTQLRWAEE